MITEWLKEKSENLGDKAEEHFNKADEEKGFKRICTFSAGVLEAFASGAVGAIPDACILGYTGLIATGFIVGAINKKKQ